MQDEAQAMREDENKQLDVITFIVRNYSSSQISSSHIERVLVTWQCMFNVMLPSFAVITRKCSIIFTMIHHAPFFMGGVWGLATSRLATIDQLLIYL